MAHETLTQRFLAKGWRNEHYAYEGSTYSRRNT
jgi:hypothetical protein